MIAYGKEKTKQQIADALMRRLGPTMNGANPGYKPPVTKKTKPIVKPGLIGFKRTITF